MTVTHPRIVAPLAIHAVLVIPATHVIQTLHAICHAVRASHVTQVVLVTLVFALHHAVLALHAVQAAALARLNHANRMNLHLIQILTNPSDLWKNLAELSMQLSL